MGSYYLPHRAVGIISKEGVYVQFISSCVYMVFFKKKKKFKKLKKRTTCLAVPSLSCITGVFVAVRGLWLWRTGSERAGR